MKLVISAFPTFIFLLSLALRLAYVYQIWEVYLFSRFPVVDAAEYLLWAKDITLGKYFPYYDEPPIHGPLYPFLIAFIFRLVGPNLLAIYIFQSFISSLSCIIIFKISEKLFGRKVGLLSSLLFALCPQLIYFCGELTTPTLEIFLNSILLFLCINQVTKHNSKYHTLIGITLGICSLAHPRILIFTIPLAILFRKKFLFVFFGMSLILAPLSILYFMRFGQVVIVQSGAGLNLYLGNSSESTGYAYVQPDARYYELVTWPRRNGQKGDFLFFLKKIYDFIISNPKGFLSLYVKKFLLIISNFEISIGIDMYEIKEKTFLKFIPFSFTPLFSLFVLGITRKLRKNSILLAFVFSYLIFLLVTVTSSRYRTPLIPVITIFASYSLLNIRYLISNFKSSIVGIFTSVLILILGIPNWFFKEKLIRTEFYCAEFFKSVGDYNKAEAILKKILEKEENKDFYHFAVLRLSEVLLAKGNLEKARELLFTVTTQRPELGIAHFLLGRVSEGFGNIEGAILSYFEALKADPFDPGSYISLGKIFFRLKEYEKAFVMFSRAKELGDHERASLWLAKLKIEVGEIKEGRDMLYNLSLNLTDPEAFQFAEELFLKIGDRKKALEMFKESKRIKRIEKKWGEFSKNIHKYPCDR